jgi:N-acetylmuramic acid 6-phosphate etherase
VGLGSDAPCLVAGSPVAVITGDAQSEAAQLASMVIAPELGADVVAGFSNTKAGIAQK